MSYDSISDLIFDLVGLIVNYCKERNVPCPDIPTLNLKIWTVLRDYINVEDA